jgi:hypothetical protein
MKDEPVKSREKNRPPKDIYPGELLLVTERCATSGRQGQLGVVMKRLLWVRVVVLLSLLASGVQAKIELRNISPQEQLELDAGRSIERRFELPHKGTKYLAAVSYGVLNSSCDRSALLWTDPGKHLAKALPATRDVKLIERTGNRARLRVTHGNAVLQGSWGATYRVSDDGATARFWLDDQAPSDVKDVFGYFRLTTWRGHGCLVTAAVAVDPGDGLLASMFRTMIHNYIVRTAARIQRYVLKQPL